LPQAERAGRQQQRQPERAAPERRVEQEADQGDQHQFDHAEQNQDAEQFADVDRWPVRRREHQGPQRLGLAFTFERAAERERAGKRDRNPQNACGRVFHRPALTHQGEGEDQNTRHGKKHRRVENLAASNLDGEVLPHHDPRDAQKLAHRRAAPTAMR
jgi:hypothetical protein